MENTKKVYDMLRAKAESMGHKAAKLPDDVFQKYMDRKEEKSSLWEAKLYVENYMMGNLNPAEFARVMAEDDNLRYTISDLCRMRLEPVNLDIERNDQYVDVGAGIKTFWTEIHVPLPSEVDAARDIRNINFGIEAARVAVGMTHTKDMSNATVSKNRSFRDILSDARKRMAEKAVEKLTPIAEGENEEKKSQTYDISWLETEDGRTYKNMVTRNVASHIENVAMAIEAGKEQSLNPDERKKALEATGMSETVADSLVSDHTEKSNTRSEYLQSGYSKDDLNRPLDNEMKALFDQIMEHVNQNNRDHNTDVPVKKKQNNKKAADDRKEYVTGIFQGKQVSFKGKFSSHTFTDEEIEKLLAGETISIEYTDKNNNIKTVSGQLEWQEYKGNTYLGFKADNSKKNDFSQTAADADDDKKNDLPQNEIDSLFSEKDEELMHYYMGEEPDGMSEPDANAIQDCQSAFIEDNELQLSGIYGGRCFDDFCV